MMKKALLVMLAIIMTANAATYNYSTIEAYTTVCDRSPVLNITAFIATPNPAYTDERPEFSITTENLGNCYEMDNVSLYIDAYNSYGFNAWNSSKTSDSGLTAGSSWTTTFSSTNFPADTYTVNLTAVYTVVNFGGSQIYNSTVRSNLTLVVSVRPVTPGTDTGGGGGGGGAPVEIPPIKKVQFHKYPVLQEIAPGSLVLVDISFTNPLSTTQKITVGLTGIPSSWINLFQDDLEIGSGETKTLSLTLDVPENADSGDYLARIDLKDTTIYGYSYFIVRVKSYPDNYIAPKIFRRVDLNFVDNKSTVKITVQNGKVSHKRVDIYERIPKELTNHVSRVSFKTAPSAILEADPLVLFTLTDLSANEKRTIDYTINNVIDLYEPYVYWPVEQISILPSAGDDKIKISNIYQSNIVPGSDENYLTFDIGNIDTRTLNVTLGMWLPKTWNASPDNIYLTIPPYTQTRVSIKITTPYGSEGGVYYGGLLVTYENSTSTKELVMRVQEEGIVGGLFGIFGLFADNAFLLLVVLAVGIIIVIRTIRTMRRYEYKEDVSSTLSEIKGLVSRRR